MEYMLYLKSIMFVLIISFACLLDNAAVVGNVRATQETNNSYGCYSSTSNNNNNDSNMDAPYHETIHQTALSIRGILNLSDSNIVLKPSMILHSSIFTTRPADSHLAIDLLDQRGRVLAHYPVDIIVSKAKVVELKDIAYISEAVPYDPCTAKITINKDDKELVSQVVSPNVPKIISIKVGYGNDSDVNPRLIFPRTSNITVEWKAQDLDKDQHHLTYSLLYSNDGGVTWPTTIADDIEQNSLTLNADSLPGNSVNLSRFRVIATDGVNTDVRDSDPFSVPVRNIGH
jgi:hypothetical protein